MTTIGVDWLKIAEQIKSNAKDFDKRMVKVLASKTYKYDIETGEEVIPSAIVSERSGYEPVRREPLPFVPNKPVSKLLRRRENGG